jgi:hypothetical protein
MSASAALSRAVANLAADRGGLITRRQLRALGIDADRVRNHIAAARWQAWGPRVIATRTGPLSAEQMAWLAVLDGGDECVLAGLSALHAAGLRGFAIERVQTAVPVGAGRPARHELFVRRVCRRLDDDAMHPTRQPRAMRVGVALVDALEHITLPLRGCALLAAVVQQRLIRASDLPSLLVREPRLPNRATYLTVANDIEGGALSLLEIDFRRIARRAGLRAPVGQSIRTDAQGRRRYLDADFGSWGVEVDGAIHLKPLAWWDDMFRLNDIVIRSKPMLRFPSVGIYLRECEVVEQLRHAAARWG